MLALQERLLVAQETLRHQATHDVLTGIWNRAMVVDQLERELARAGREGQSLAVILADLDHFKSVNDTYGHAAGDAVLREAAARMVGVPRRYDFVGRYGGEEFLVVLPNCELAEAAKVAERVRAAVAGRPNQHRDDRTAGDREPRGWPARPASPRAGRDPPPTGGRGPVSRQSHGP